jgi:hypothetical protein
LKTKTGKKRPTMMKKMKTKNGETGQKQERIISIFFNLTHFKD